MLIALLMYVYGYKSVEFPPSNSPELDVLVNNQPLSIKTKSSRGLTGVKVVWTVDWNKIDDFLRTYVPASHLLYINIIWGKTGSFFLIPEHVQRAVLERLTIINYTKVPPRVSFEQILGEWNSQRRRCISYKPIRTLNR